MLTAKVDLADDTTVYTGLLDRVEHPWLAEHSVGGLALLPGSALVDLVWHVAEENGFRSVDELALHAPVPVPDEPARLRVTVSPENREALVHTRGPDGEWVHHATAALGAEAPDPTDSLAEWPPPGAEPVPVDDLYPDLVAGGLDYGPTFRAVRGVWRDGAHTYVEAALPDGTDTLHFGLHPALLDAALHPLALGKSDEQVMPFAFTGAVLHARGASVLRVRLTVRGREALSLLAADVSGAPVASVDELRLRAVPTVTRAQRNELFHLAWRPLDEAPNGESTERHTFLGAPGSTSAPEHHTAVVLHFPAATGLDRLGDDVVTAVQRHGAALAAWLETPGNDEIPLIVATTGAVATEPGPLDLVHAPLWGMTRAAQAEHTGRIVLLDLDPADPVPDDVDELLNAVLASQERQLAVRGGVLLAPRLAPVPVPEPDRPDQDGTVLVTGANGGIAWHVAEHLVTHHGVKHLLLLSRSHPTALAEHVTSLGGVPIALACDVADPDRLAEALAAIPEEHPLQAVVHTAAVLDDATLRGITAEQLARVLRTKVRGTLVLEELTRGVPTVLYSSAAATFGGAGQAGYAAANTFLDAFAHDRRAAGLPVTSVGWGLWDTGTGMAARLGESDLRRVRRGGFLPMSPARALALHDVVGGAGHAHLVASPIAVGSLRHETAHPLLRELVPARARTRLRSAANAEDASELVIRLRAQAEDERRATLLAIVRGQANAVLGHPEDHPVDDAQPFRELGFDSLTAVELRNRLHAATGLHLPATVVFDHPRPEALARFLGERLLGAAAPRERVVAASSAEPIAVVGLACRFPGGVAGPEDLWRLLAEGGDAIGAFPTDRGWDLDALFDEDPDRPGTSYAREGGFLEGVADFDAAFFGISPREALAMDPQQRLLLETAWHAVEDAGIDPTTLRGTPTGVFTGISNQDYTRLARDLPPEVEGYLGTGNAGSVLSGRLAYVLGLEGPAMTVDTACSSSLVALHLAAQSLRSGESTLALAGGVTVMATPSVFVEFSRQRGLAADGRSKAFAATADGMGPAEGIGVLLLERLSDARRNNHRVHAVIKGSAVNQDGASNGLSAPSGPAQQRVIRTALHNAGLAPSDVDVVEAHGTGTALGDPIEAQALFATYGQDRDRPLHLGSIKSNIGHTQAAAGVAGVLKVVLAMRHGVVPPTLHAADPTPHVDWDGQVVLTTTPVPWPETGRPRRAGVSAFGISGTNAHLVLEQGPEVPEPVGDTGLPVPVLLSARTPGALRNQALGLRDHLATSSPRACAHTLATARTAFPHRLALVAAPGADIRDELTALASSVPSSAPPDGLTAFLFTGQGSQRAAGAELCELFPVFAKALDEVCAALDQHLGLSTRGLVLTPTAEQLARTDLVQPALFALQVALAALLDTEHGVRPRVLLGHSVGEVAAAHVAGVLDLADAAALVTARGRLMAELPADGAMVAIAASEQEVLAAIEGLEHEVSVAAVNGPLSTVLSGTGSVVDEVAARFARTKRLRVDRAFHSPQLDGLLEGFREVVEGLAFRAPDVPLLSNVDGRVVGDEVTTAEYWVRQARRPVRFADCVGEALRLGVTRMVELGPDAVLTPLVRDLVPTDHVVRPLVRRGHSEAETLVRALAGLWSGGAAVRWSTLLPRSGGTAPGYGFDRRRYWLDGGFTVTAAPAAAGTPFDGGGVDDLVRRTAAAVLGHSPEDFDPDAPFADLGIDSMTATELRGRLEAAAEVRLTATAVYDHPSANALAAHVADLLAKPEAAPSSAIGSLYWAACSDGRSAEAGELLRAAARLRPAFTAADPPEPPTPVRLSSRSGEPVPLLCLPSFNAVAGPHEFARFAAALPHEVWALPEPGFGAGEAIPADLAAIVAVQVAAVRAVSGGRPCVLVGRSASGLLANALAAAVEAEGDPVRAVVLLDVYPPAFTEENDWVERELNLAVAARESGAVLHDDARLITMGRYFEAFAGWRPSPTGAPTLHVRAAEPFSPAITEFGDWRSSWDLEHREVDTAGDHFTILEGFADTTAAAVDAWLRT
ncbi:type I polyketide synthase [Umezawaea sp.]|uniref:type I polyketide synthase n=1 Tax=Umezawaea sp. TaxID=1955258 RepID=UPI002ED46B57